MLSTSYYMSLKAKPVAFEPVSAVNNVFFDEVNKQIFTVRSGGATGVVVRGPEDSNYSSFQVDAKGSPISIKYSYHQEYLGIQRSKTAVELFPVVNGQPSENKQILSSKTVGNNVLTFHWISNSEIILVTKAGAEFYQDGRMLKMSSFPLDTNAHGRNGSSPTLNEKDVTLLTMYNEFYVALVRHSTSTLTNTLIELYLLSRDLPVQKKFILVTKVQGRLAISVVDNLVVVHHQTSKSSMVFDIRLPGIESGGTVQIGPVVDPMPIQSQIVQVPGFSLTRPMNEVECQMYAPTWIVFPPNIIIDAALGFMWFLEIKLDVIMSMFNDFGLLIEFLLLRRGSKSIILKSLKKCLASRQISPTYSDVGRVFDTLNNIYKKFLDAEQAIVKARQKHDAAGSSEKTLHHPSHGASVVIDQSDIYMHVLAVIANEEGVDHKHIVCVVIEYIRSLDDCKIQPQDYLYELIIKALMLSKDFYALEQYIHNGIIPLTKSACGRLIPIIANDPETAGLVIDLWKKVPDCGDELVDALLSNRKVLQALRFVKATSMQNSVSARKFLEAAQETEDDILFYETYKYFENRNYSLRGNTSFTSGEQCEAFVRYFREKFGRR